MKIQSIRMWKQGVVYGDNVGIYYHAEDIRGCLGYCPPYLRLLLSSQSFCGSWKVALHYQDKPADRHFLLTDDHPSPCAASGVTPSLFRRVCEHVKPDEWGFDVAFMFLCDDAVADQMTVATKKGYKQFPGMTFKQWISAQRLIAWYSEKPDNVYLSRDGLCMEYPTISVFIQPDGRRCS